MGGDGDDDAGDDNGDGNTNSDGNSTDSEHADIDHNIQRMMIVVIVITTANGCTILIGIGPLGSLACSQGRAQGLCVGQWLVQRASHGRSLGGS